MLDSWPLIPLGILCLPVSAAAGEISPTAPLQLTTVRHVLVERTSKASEGPSTSPLLHSELEVLVGGTPAPIQSVERPASPWDLVLYFDLHSGTSEGIQAAARSLAELSEDLVALGAVDVVVGGRWPEAFVESTRDPGNLREALAWVEEVADTASQEKKLNEQSYLALLGWLALKSARGPRCLFLVQNGFDPGSGPSGSEARIDTRSVQMPLSILEVAERTLAAENWIVFPVTRTAISQLNNLAKTTGGESLSSTQEISSALEGLGRRWLVTYELSGPPDQGPVPLEIRSRSPHETLVAPRWASVTTPEVLARARATWLLEDPSQIEAGLATRSVLRLDETGDSSSEIRGTLEALLTLAPQHRRAPATVFRVVLLLARLEAEPLVLVDHVPTTDLARADRWLYRRHLDIPADTAEALVIIEELISGDWGGALAELGGEPLEADGPRTAQYTPGAIPRNAEPRPPAVEQVVIRLLPPQRRQVTGKTRFQTLVSTAAVIRVDFFLDGDLVATDERSPFTATLVLETEPHQHTVLAEAYDRSGRKLGEHSIVINPDPGTFSVLITRISEPSDGGAVEIEADVQIPTTDKLDRVEFYRNEKLVEQLMRPPWRTRLDGSAPGPADYVRVVAYLASGEVREDAQLLAAPGLAERLEVNLVELHVTVTDHAGVPVRDLQPEDFTVRFGRERLAVERFALADDVPLVLGLVIDTSESMWPLMPDTKKAGSQFLAETLTTIDQAFLVDFDTRPRLAQETTPDLLALLRRFNGLTAEGFTALYDAVIFSLLQFEQASGRKALVLLTDGDDYRSQYGPRRCIRYGRRLGVPVYIISLAALQDPHRDSRRIDLEGITEGTGGRVYYIKQMTELTATYAQINNELRSQYVIAFSTPRPLAEAELAEIKVQVRSHDYSVRVVIGGQTVE